MKRLLAITGRDVQGAFSSPIAYVVMAAFAIVSGIMFIIFLSFYQSMAQQLLSQPMGATPEMLAQANVVEMVLNPLFGNASVIFLLMIPALTMRLFSEERKSGTDELLMTAPVTVAQVVIGKYLAGLVLILALMATTAIPVFSLFLFGNLPVRAVLASFLGLFLLGATFVSVGLLASALTENQVVAAVLSFAFLLSFFIIGWAGEQIGEASKVGKVLSYLSITDHFDDFTKGVIDTSHLIYYVSFTFLALFLTSRIVESRRWR